MLEYKKKVEKIRLILRLEPHFLSGNGEASGPPILWPDQTQLPNLLGRVGVK